MVFEIRTVTITEKGQIVIPKSLRSLDGFEVGGKIAVLAYNDRIELRPVNKILKNLDSAIASEAVLAKDWSTKEDDEAWKNL